MAELLLGKPVADDIREAVKTRACALSAEGRKPCLATVRVGSSQDDEAYARSIAKAAEALGISLSASHFPEDVSESELLRHMEMVNDGDSIDGCMLFRPLPKHLDEAMLCNSLAPSKDVDAIGAEALARVFMGEAGSFAPATAEACIRILDFYGIPLEGSHVAVVGRSLVIGKPVGMLALGRNSTVTYCHSRTSGLSDITSSADIVICAVGKAGFFDSGFFHEGQVVLDVGMNTDSNGALCGDVDFENVEPLVKAITPVPRGVGSVTTSVLLEHVVSAAERR